jgi:predicted Fe-Mo cluster-binding NifX family protein
MISMKNELVAIPVFQDRISPLLDVANRFVIFEIVDNEISQKMIVNVHADCERLRIEKLKELGVSVIIGSAVSGFVSHVISEIGMRLISWVNGEIDDVIDLYIKDALNPSNSEASACGHGMGRGRCTGKNRRKRVYKNKINEEKNENSDNK